MTTINKAAASRASYTEGGAEHTDLCVDEALHDLHTGLVFAQAAPEGRGYHARLWRRYVSTVRARLWSVRFPPPIILLRNLNPRFVAESDVDWNTKRGQRLADRIALLHAISAKGARVPDPSEFDKE